MAQFVASTNQLNDIEKHMQWVSSNKPSIEKNSMKPAEIWTTLRLPTRVRPNKPTFSLHKLHDYEHLNYHLITYEKLYSFQ